jgi:hypothetical protein
MKVSTAAAIVAAVLLFAPQAAFATDQPPSAKAADSPSKGTIVLGMPLISTTRASVHETLKASNVPAKREDDRYWYDLYDASDVLDGADQLSMGYSLRDGRLGEVRYHFPAFMDPQKVRQIAEMVAEKYGKPNRSSGNVSLGEVEYVWTLPDGVVLTVSRGWPDTSVSLGYQVPAVFRQMTAEQAENDKAEKESAAKRQSKNF